MIRTRPNNHRPWSSMFGILVVCAALGLSADHAAADPSDLDTLQKRTLRTPKDLGTLRAKSIEHPIVIGPIPGFQPDDRYPHEWTPGIATARGPRTKRTGTYHIVLSFSKSAGRSAR